MHRVLLSGNRGPDNTRTRNGASSLAYRNGSIAMMLALVCASIVAMALHAASPLEPVADLVMDHTPVSLAIPLLLRLGPLARPLALWGAIAIALVIGGLLGLVYPALHRHAVEHPDGLDPRAPRGVSLRLAALPGLILAAGVLTALVTLVAPSGHPVVEAALVVTYLVGLYGANRRVEDVAGRRAFLAHNARVVAGFAALTVLLYVAPLVHAFRTRLAGHRLFPWSPPRPRKPGFDLAGLAPEVTPPDQFYEMDEDMQRPDIALEEWNLSVEGLVQRPLRLSFADLLALPRRDALVTQECVSNPVGGPLMSTALFSGVPVAALLARSGLASGATAVLFRAPDGHEEAIPLGLALDGRTMIAYARGGQLLEQAHGFPARALVPGLYGFKSVKWVETVRITTDPRAGWWERDGWSSLPAVQTTARIDVYRRGPAGLLLAGVAFAGRRGITAVQARVNDGPWQSAALHTPALSPRTWVQWRVTIPAAVLPPRGGLTVQARAVDGAGHVQTAREHDQQPAGATGYHTVTL